MVYNIEFKRRIHKFILISPILNKPIKIGSGEGKVFFAEECQLINVEEMIEIGKSPVYKHGED